jgi:Domain of unknown function (DUF5063)
VQSTEIRAAIRQFLSLIDAAEHTVQQDEEVLPYLLDQLAFAQHFVRFTFDESDYPDSPRRDQSALRQLISRRYPNYGYYNIPDVVTTNIAESKCVVGDAIDDLLDISNDLLDVEWRWSNTSEADALWHFQNSYSSHWQAHLRGLQLYLHSLSSEAA